MRIETVTLLEIVAAARGRHASLVPESAGYLVLGVGQASGGLPLRVEPACVLLNTEGVVSFAGPKQQLADDLCARRLRTILATLLDASQGSGAALHAALSAPEIGPAELTALYKTVAKALIPLNRSAAKRALARLARETLRAKTEGLLVVDDVTLEEPGESCDQAQAGDEDETAAAPPKDSEAAEADASEAAPAEQTDSEEESDEGDEAAAAASGEDDDEPETAAVDDWEDVDLDIELATPTPSPAMHEATPTFVDPPNAGPASELGVAVKPIEDPEPLEDEAAESDDVAPEESVSADELGGQEASMDLADELPDASWPAPVTVTAVAEDGATEAQDDEPDDDQEMRPSATPVIGSCSPPTGAMLAALDTSIDEAIHELDGDALRGAQADAPDDPVDDPPATPSTATENGPAISPAPPAADVAAEHDSAEPVEPVEPEPELDPLEAEALLAERLIADVRRQRGNARQSWRRAKRAKVKGIVTDRVRQRRRDEGRSQTLLERFAASEPDDDSINDAAASLMRLTAIDGTPLPVPIAVRAPRRAASRPAAPTWEGTARDDDASPAPAEVKQAVATSETVEAADLEEPAETASDADLEEAEDTADPVDPAAFSEPPMDVTDEAETVSPALALPAAELADLSDQEPLPDSSPLLEQVEELAMSLDEVIEESPSPSPVTVPNTMLAQNEANGELPEDPSIPPTFMPEPLRTPRASLFVSATLLLVGLVAVGFIYLWHPSFFQGRSAAADGDTTARHGNGATKRCSATLTLRDLPSPHEVLLWLGRSPVVTGPLPTGVRLELLALAPDHQPERLVVPAGTEWKDQDGTPTLNLTVALQPGPTLTWPEAPDGEVGGIGPAGTIRLEAEPAAAELWLVATAGTGTTGAISVPCDQKARILVVNPEQPEQQRRLSVEPKLLQAAAANGGAELSVNP